MNDKKIEYLIEGISKDIIAYLMEDNGMKMTDAISVFHNSGRQWHENDRCHFCIPQFGDICEALRSEHGTLHREFGLCI